MAYFKAGGSPSFHHKKDTNSDDDKLRTLIETATVRFCVNKTLKTHFY